MKKIFLFVLMSCALLADTKIGYIDSGVILSKYEDVRQVQVELEKEQKKLQVIYETKISSLDSLRNAYETRSMLMSEEKQTEILNSMSQKEAELQQWQLQYFGPEGELYRMQNELMAPILRTIDQALDKVGKEKSYDYIFDASSGGIVYALDTHNLTQDILDELKKINTSIDIDQLK
jgi:outer membrane protein